MSYSVAAKKKKPAVDVNDDENAANPLLGVNVKR
jgi:hypothetical protein